MAVYQSGTEPRIRKRHYSHWEPQTGMTFQPHVIRRIVMRNQRIPRKAIYFLTEQEGMHIHHFSWWEVETNA